MSLRVYPIVTVTSNLGNAERILVRHETQALRSVGKRLVEETRPKMREFLGKSKQNVRYLLSGSRLNKLVEVFGTLVQTYVDENGLPPGIFPPWGVGTPLYKWVERKGLASNTQRSEFHSAGGRRRPRKVSHVSSRRPAATRKRVEERRGKGTEPPRTQTHARRQHKRRVAEQSGRSRRSATRDRAIRRVAFLVARSIFERGIRAEHPFARTLEENRQRIVHDLQDAFMRAVEEINRGS